MPESKAQARTKIDQALQTSGWSVQPYRDFQYEPFPQCGRLGKEHQLFGTDLPNIVKELNEVLPV